MRKFTKEITALIASIAVSATVSTASATSEEIVETTAVEVAPTEIIVTTAGVPLPPDDYTEPTVVIETTAGVAIQPDDYTDPTEEIPPVDGGLMPPDDYTEPTTEEFPPLAGEPLPSDEYIETTEEFPPLAGDVALPDGDVDGNGSFNFADVVSFSKYLMNKSENEPDNLYAADICTDGKINVFDLVAMKRKIIEQSVPVLSENSYDYALVEKYDNLTESNTQISVYTQNDEALVMWKIPVIYQMDGCENTITSIDSCTYKTENSETIEIVKSDNVYYYGDSPKGYTYCVIKALKEGNATLTLDCEYSDRYIEFTVDNELNISITE